MTIILTHNRQRSPVRSFSRIKALAAYIDDRAKCTATAAFNFDDAPDRKDQIADMANAAELLDRGGSLKLIQHWALSWKPEAGEEPPTHEEIFHAAHEALDLLGYGECMAMVAIHENTGHIHAHIVFSRINADQDRVVKEPHGYGRAQKATAIIARAHGWKTEPRTQYEVTDEGELKRRFVPPRPKTPTAPAPSTLKEKLANFYADQSGQFHGWKWGNLHRMLATYGLEMACKKGQGIVFSADGQTWESAATACPAMTQTALARALDGSPRYRQARPEVAQILAQARAAQSIQNTKNKTQTTTQPQNTNHKTQKTISTPVPDTERCGDMLGWPTKEQIAAFNPLEDLPDAAPQMPEKAAQKLRRFHQAATDRLKRGREKREKIFHMAMRLRICGHSEEEAKQVLEEPKIVEIAYSKDCDRLAKKMAPLAATLRAQEKQALLPAGFAQRLEEEQRCRMQDHNQSPKSNPD